MDNGTSLGNITMLPPSMSPNGSGVHMPNVNSMMHMSFFWGREVGILCPLGFPVGLSLFIMFLISMTMEGYTAWSVTNPKKNTIAAWVGKSLMHGGRMYQAFLVLLAVKSYNAGLLLVAIAGHFVGFFIFRCFNRGHAQPLIDEGPIPITSVPVKL